MLPCTVCAARGLAHTMPGQAVIEGTK
jgi:hypothetical protein